MWWATGVIVFMCKNTFCQNCKKKLLELANNAIVSYLILHRKPNNINEKKLAPVFLKPRGSFVTVEVNGLLRGCIGQLESGEPLYKDIVNNAIEAAFYDWRFESLSKEDLAGLKIEISLLTKPKKLEFKDVNELLKILEKQKPGVVLQKGFHKATFLPQVWEKVFDAEQFLTELSLKAGLNADAWKDCEIFTYQAEVFS